MQNIGAYGVEIKDVFHELEALHVKEKYLRTFTSEECEFGYRESIFKRKLREQFIITSVTFRLNKTPRLNTSYGAIGKELENMRITEPGIRDVSNAVIRIRTSKLPDPKVLGNAGSFFKNPEVPAAHFHSLKKDHENIVGYEVGNGNIKLAAGWLIESCGWKGFREGDAGVHKDQALVLVNYKDASGDQVYDLSQKVMDSVQNKFGVQLEREVNII
jgi:UDP-N-acetylmuramate dehydrogenase